ncbi:MAG TPA: SDR family oxidoreductase [Deltaproteobacteria bacterium]|nr:SDR family oxidoreductase [Deltaproteobacteria bacterium]
MKRTALITGASAGLGAEFAEQLAAENVDLVLVARRKAKLDALAEALRRRHGIEVTTLSADLARPDTPREIFEATRSAGLQIDYLINNAGSGGPQLFEEPEWAPQAEFLQLMMISVTHLCHHFIPPMRERGFGRVINVASFAGRLARPAGAHYGPSKAYLIALSEELALSLAGTGVRVSALCPGFTHTDFHAKGDLAEMKKSIPAFFWYDARTVVREGLQAVEKGRPIMVSGRLYRWLDPLAQSVFIRPLLKSIAPGRNRPAPEKAGNPA